MDAKAQEAYDKRWWALSVLCLSLVLIVAANSSLNVTLPSLQRALNATPSGLQWTVDVYSLVFAGLLLPAGAAADRYGRKTALQLGLVVFGLACLAAMTASNVWQIATYRAIMGVGAAFIMPGTLSILTNVFPPKERARAISIWAGFAGFGGVIGLIASGILLEHFYWGSVFFINLPIIVIALVAGAFLLPNSKHPEETSIDPPGTVLAVVGLAVLLFGIIQAPEKGWLTGPILLALGLGVVLLVGFVLWELHTDDPMLDVRLFKVRPFSVGSGTITLQFLALYGLYFAIAQYFQLAHGYTPLAAALATLPLGAVTMVGAPISAPMVHRFGPRRVVGTGLLVTATGFFVLATSARTTPLWWVFLGECLIGLGVGQTTAPSTTLIMSSVRTAKAGVGSAVNDVSREVGGALGIAVVGSIINSVYRATVTSKLDGAPASVSAAAKHSVADGLAALAKSGTAGTSQLAHDIEQTFARAFGIGMFAGAVTLVITAGLVWKFQHRDRPADIARMEAAAQAAASAEH
jgi:EmrB/QacA subfamily drug resistance transporter